MVDNLGLHGSHRTAEVGKVRRVDRFCGVVSATRLRTVFSVVLAVAMLGGIASAPIGRSATPGLVAAYAFDEGSGTTVADASGGGNNGAVANATWMSAGKYGGALEFDGSGARVLVPDADSLRLTTAMTLEAWVNPSTVSDAWRDVIYKGNDNYYLSATSTQPSGVPAGGGIFDGSYGEAFGTSVLAPNTWTHLAVTYDGSALSLYVNGAPASSLAKTGKTLNRGGRHVARHILLRQAPRRV